MVMSEATRLRIVATAAQARRWNADKIELTPMAELDRAGCVFYLAGPQDAMAHVPQYFALLPDGRVAGVDLRGDDAAAALLHTCGRDAPAEWWAKVMTRFSASIGASVLTANGNPYGIRRVRERGAQFTPPALNRSAIGTTELSFFAYDGELKVPYQVRAELSVDGRLRIDAKAL